MAIQQRRIAGLRGLRQAASSSSLQFALRVPVAVLAVSLSLPGFAQSSNDVLRGVQGVIDLLGKGQGQSVDRRAGDGITRTAPRQEDIIAPTPGIFPTRQALLDATRRGELLALYRAPENDKKLFRLAVYAILVNEYRVPPFGYPCMNSFDRDVGGLFMNLARAWSHALTDVPPTFTQNDPAEVERTKREVQAVRDGWQRRTICDGNAMGQTVPHPYKTALWDLFDQYEAASREAVANEAKRRQDVHATNVARAQEAAAVQREQAAQEQAAQRAAAQQRLEAENARIRAEEQRRAERERNRIGG